MKQKEIFELSVRLIGLWFVFLAIKGLPGVFDYLGAVVGTILYAVTGWWFLGGAPILTNRAFPAGSPTLQIPSETAATPPDEP